MKRMILSVCAFALLAAHPAPGKAQSSLPPQVQADLLLQKIEANMVAGKAQEALDGLAKYRELSVKMPPTLIFLEGRLAAMAKDYRRSKTALTEYLADPNARADKNYSAALSLYADVEQAGAAAYAAQCLAIAGRSGVPLTACQNNSSFRDIPSGPEMIVVPGGTFLMGSPESEAGRWKNEGPQRQVRIEWLAVGKFEVTSEEWDACITAGGCNGHKPERNYGAGNRHPVTHVNWSDAQAYVRWLSQATGKSYRLLSEAEWEYAARGGTTTPYSTGLSITSLQANFNSSGRSIKSIGSYPANPFGLYDLHGNVSEWTEDCWNDSYLSAPDDGTPRLSGGCTSRVARGGHWNSVVEGIRSAVRFQGEGGERIGVVGFRLARTLF